MGVFGQSYPLFTNNIVKHSFVLPLLYSSTDHSFWKFERFSSIICTQSLFSGHASPVFWSIYFLQSFFILYINTKIKSLDWQFLSQRLLVNNIKALTLFNVERKVFAPPHLWSDLVFAQFQPPWIGSTQTSRVFVHFNYLSSFTCCLSMGFPISLSSTELFINMICSHADGLT